MKKIIAFFVLTFILSLVALPAGAQDNVTHTINFDEFSFTFDTAIAENVDITQYAGDPAENGAGFAEVKHTQFRLYSGVPASESMLDAAGGIRLYATADFAPYEADQRRLEQLQQLLADKPELADYMQVNAEDGSDHTLPFIPVFPAGQIIRAQAEYLDTPSFQGIRYVTIYRQDVSPFLAHEFLYTYQGLSADGSTYVSAVFTLNTSLFPAEIGNDFNYDTFLGKYNEYMTDAIQKLNDAKPEDITPSLAGLDAVVTSMTLNG